METGPERTYAADVADVIEIDHIRRARKLFSILLGRMGVEYFLSPREGPRPRIDPRRCHDTLELCCDWIHRRTGTVVPDATREVMQRQLRRLLIQQIAETLVRAGY